MFLLKLLIDNLTLMMLQVLLHNLGILPNRVILHKVTLLRDILHNSQGTHPNKVIPLKDILRSRDTHHTEHQLETPCILKLAKEKQVNIENYTCTNMS